MISANLHNLKAVTAGQHGSVAWLDFKGDDVASYVSVFMPLSVAEAMAEAYRDAMVAHENAAEEQALEVQAAGTGDTGHWLNVRDYATPAATLFDGMAS